MKGVFEIEERSHDEKIMRRLSEHLDAVKEKHPEWVGIFLQGSQNYKLDYEGSDVDSKLIVLPSFEDFVLNRKPYSYTHIMENDEHVDVKDIRLMFDCFRKQNINFVEILFTKYRILNPKYASLFSAGLGLPRVDREIQRLCISELYGWHRNGEAKGALPPISCNNR